MNTRQSERYSRHILLKELGMDGQEKILAAHALVIGAGGLGSPACYYLASAGIGKITLVDDDTVDLSNLQRQILHTTDRIGQPKAVSGKTTLSKINPDIDIIALNERPDEFRLHELAESASVVLDCTDNFASRHIINRVCVASRRPLVSGAALQFDGQVSVYDMRANDAPCYSCLFSADQPFEDRKAAQFGVFAPVVGIIGTIQAAEALKLVAGIGKSLAGSLLILDGLTMSWTRIQLDRNPDCPVCGKHQARAINHEAP
ncbi:HesA/MoeB/ThiF family protein [Oxalobacter vibrioformis]|uniref:HesA/MoeB/ThiF family protein n=1 Tax=Oxalobacter vibrioformis TaxID=933080 RepID=A0A9E9LYN8_9BURK|nr:HesA/MoeB/ThiF family protein [Oxalobacter vibrioformis]WAW11162.1 HesA/MoeB/ThiF family protein [Oxalobacter vibrioformis]